MRYFLLAQNPKIFVCKLIKLVIDNNSLIICAVIFWSVDKINKLIFNSPGHGLKVNVSYC